MLIGIADFRIIFGRRARQAIRRVALRAAFGTRLLRVILGLARVIGLRGLGLIHAPPLPAAKAPKRPLVL
ncbi:MAG: hypothetical protein QOF83_1925, partial [Solirubrobacteraceae bacterium]|nr:hypothetical protein [Solirubrobacteraceae bacterium]